MHASKYACGQKVNLMAMPYLLACNVPKTSKYEYTLHVRQGFFQEEHHNQREHQEGTSKATLTKLHGQEGAKQNATGVKHGHKNAGKAVQAKAGRSTRENIGKGEGEEGEEGTVKPHLLSSMEKRW